jgi:hypothetical protein
MKNEKVSYCPFSGGDLGRRAWGTYIQTAGARDLAGLGFSIEWKSAVYLS